MNSTKTMAVQVRDWASVAERSPLPAAIVTPMVSDKTRSRMATIPLLRAPLWRADSLIEQSSNCGNNQFRDCRRKSLDQIFSSEPVVPSILALLAGQEVPSI